MSSSSNVQTSIPPLKESEFYIGVSANDTVILQVGSKASFGCSIIPHVDEGRSASRFDARLYGPKEPLDEIAKRPY